MSLNDVDITQILISKPRKSDSTYICPIYYHIKKEKLIHVFENAIIVSIKPLQQRDEYFVYIKCKSSNNFIYDVNKHIIDVVRNKSIIWFNNNMNTDLIEDYYTNTLIYDKMFGDVIRLKCVGNESLLNGYINQKTKLTVVFDHIRFYKQKFVLECHVDDVQPTISICEIKDITDSECDDDPFIDDVPFPNNEDVKKIKEECLDTTNKYIVELKTKLYTMEYKIQGIEKIKSELLNTNLISDIIRLCNDLENICE